MDSAVTALATFDAFETLEPSARCALAAPLAAALGTDFAPHDTLLGARKVVAVRHVPTGIFFMAIPGGSFEMGLTDQDVADAAGHVDFTSGVRRWLDDLKICARPVRRVQVRPFLAAYTRLSPDSARRLGGGAYPADTCSAKAALDFIRTTAFRLPSEAELEYLARDGGALHFTCDAAHALARGDELPEENGFGLYDLLAGEWAADAWHDNYEGAPSSSTPWNDGGPPGVYRGALPYGVDQNKEEILFALAALRGRAATRGESDDGSRTFFGIRLTRDLSF